MKNLPDNTLRSKIDELHHTIKNLQTQIIELQDFIAIIARPTKLSSSAVYPSKIIYEQAVWPPFELPIPSIVIRNSEEIKFKTTEDDDEPVTRSEKFDIDTETSFGFEIFQYK